MRREYEGGARRAKLTADLSGDDTDEYIYCDNLTGWPTGEVGPFAISIARTTMSEEKILCSSRNENILTIWTDGDQTGRGYDGTAILPHSIDAEVEHIFTAIDADEANDHVNRDNNVHGVDGSLPDILEALDAADSALALEIANIESNLDDLETEVDGKEPLLPSRTGQDGKFLSADGGWQTVPPGEPGDPGPAGDSAYQIAVDNGFVGTEEEWLDSLKGDPGDPGEDGLDGVQIDDDTPSAGTTYSSSKIEELIGAGGGYVAQDTPPDDTDVLWVNTSDDPDLMGRMFIYFDGDWIEVGSAVGGGGGAAKADLSRLYTAGSDVTFADEFDDDSIDGAWLRVDKSGGTGRVVWTESGGALSVLSDGYTTQDAAGELHGLLIPYALAVGEYIETRMSWAGPPLNYPHAGLVITDDPDFGEGTQVGGIKFVHTGAVSTNVGLWSGWNSRNTWSDYGSWSQTIPHFMRLLRFDSDTYQLFISPDGVSWAAYAANDVSITPTHVGIAVGGWTQASQFAWSFDYFRIGSVA